MFGFHFHTGSKKSGSFIVNFKMPWMYLLYSKERRDAYQKHITRS